MSATGQLHLIEENRTTGGLHLETYLSGNAIQDGQYLPVSESQISHEINQSDWITLLEQAGYRPSSTAGTGSPECPDTS
jgi:hypothetical protein